MANQATCQIASLSTPTEVLYGPVDVQDVSWKTLLKNVSETLFIDHEVVVDAGQHKEAQDFLRISFATEDDANMFISMVNFRTKKHNNVVFPVALSASQWNTHRALVEGMRSSR